MESKEGCCAGLWSQALREWSLLLSVPGTLALGALSGHVGDDPAGETKVMGGHAPSQLSVWFLSASVSVPHPVHTLVIKCPTGKNAWVCLSKASFVFNNAHGCCRCRLSMSCLLKASWWIPHPFLLTIPVGNLL